MGAAGRLQPGDDAAEVVHHLVHKAAVDLGHAGIVGRQFHRGAHGGAMAVLDIDRILHERQELGAAELVQVGQLGLGRVAHLAPDLGHQVAHDLALVAKVQIERGAGDAGLLGQLLDRQRGKAFALVQQALAGADHAGDGGGRLVGAIVARTEGDGSHLAVLSRIAHGPARRAAAKTGAIVAPRPRKPLPRAPMRPLRHSIGHHV